jgi:aromatic-amino-acid transaminase
MLDERGRLDVSDLDKKLQGILDAQGRALVFLNSPCHNPTGYSFDDDDWAGAIEVIDRACARGPVSVLVDVAYARYAQKSLDGAFDRLLPLAERAMVLCAWSASKSFTQYGLRVGALVAVCPDAEERRRVQSALVYSCRGTWSNCNAAGMAAIARVLTDAELRGRVDSERAGLKALLDRRVARWNELAGPAGITYPRYDGGFFTTVLCAEPQKAAARLREEGIFVVPAQGGLRVALCSVAERDVPRLVDGIRRATAS